VERSVLELKGFAKVTLEQGETQTVEMSVPVNDLAYYDVTEDSWVLEGLEYDVHIGTSSRDLPLSTTLSVAAKQSIELY
jgi:beta-glucosidase